MTREDLQKLVADLGWIEQGFRSDWITLQCPLAFWRHQGGTDNNPSFGISIGDDPPHCVCLACGYTGRLTDALTELIARLPKGTAQRKQAVRAISGIPITKRKGSLMPVKTSTKAVHDPIFPGYWLESFPAAQEHFETLSYLMGRGVPSQAVPEMDVRYDPNMKRVCFPIYDWSGVCRGMQGRTLLKDAKPKYLFYKYNGAACGHEVLLGEHHVDVTKPVLLLEGAFDYAALFPYTRQILVLWGSRITDGRIKRLSQLMKIYTAFDADEAGDRARAAIKATSLPITNLMIPEGYKDVSDMSENGKRHLANYVELFGKL